MNVVKLPGSLFRLAAAMISAQAERTMSMSRTSPTVSGDRYRRMPAKAALRSSTVFAFAKGWANSVFEISVVGSAIAGSMPSNIAWSVTA